MPGRDDEHDDFDDLDEPDVLDEQDNLNREGDHGGWPAPGHASRAGGGRPRRRPLFALIAVVAGTASFGLVASAVNDVSGASPTASSTPAAGSSAPSGGTQLSPSVAPSALPAGASMRLELTGDVTAVSATSITVAGAGPSVTAAVTSATRVTGKTTRIGGVKVGDPVSVTMAGTVGHLVAESIQDPGSFSAGPGQ